MQRQPLCGALRCMLRRKEVVTPALDDVNCLHVCVCVGQTEDTRSATPFSRTILNAKSIRCSQACCNVMRVADVLKHEHRVADARPRDGPQPVESPL